MMDRLVYAVVASALAMVLVACDPATEEEQAAGDADDAAERVEWQRPQPMQLPELANRIEVMAQSCAACHGTAGDLETDIPAIAGGSEAVLSAQLLAFKRDEMPDATVMPRLTKGFTDEELQALAAYFAKLNDESDDGLGDGLGDELGNE